MDTFEIPAEFKDQLERVEVTDTRSVEEIIESLTKHVPVTSEKNVWAYWHAGVRAMPPWVQRNVADWVRICEPTGWTIRIVDTVFDSPNNALKFVDAKLLPEAFVKGTMEGPYVGPHSSDFLRGALLWTHGGVNIDVGCILFRNFDRICWNKLEDPSSPYQVAVPLMYSQTMANHFVAARKGDPFIKRWHDLFVHVWEGHNCHEGLLNNPLISFGGKKDLDESRASNFHWDFSVPPKTIMEYITQVICWDRLCHLEEAGDGFSCVDYWATHILTFDVLQENWAAETVVGFKNNGQSVFNCLRTRLDADPQSPEYKQAYDLVWRLLARSSMQKITHGKGLTHDKHLGVILDDPDNKGKDAMPGTFGELLRYGSVHFRQTRADIVLMEAQRPTETMKKGVLEP